jgi:hypothetical protein
LTTLSIGVEKFLKLAIGLSELQDEKPWPSKHRMQKEFGHGIAFMDALVRSKIRLRMTEQEWGGYVEGHLSKVENDPVLPFLLRALDSYGRSGRFYNLDTLAEDKSPFDSPVGEWDKLQNVVIQHDGAVLNQFTRAVDTNAVEDMEMFRALLYHHIASSIQGWWQLMVVLARHRAFGEYGVQFGLAGDPAMASLG